MIDCNIHDISVFCKVFSLSKSDKHQVRFTDVIPRLIFSTRFISNHKPSSGQSQKHTRRDSHSKIVV